MELVCSTEKRWRREGLIRIAVPPERAVSEGDHQALRSVRGRVEDVYPLHSLDQEDSSDAGKR